jgi:hypothetical protein
VSNQVTVLNLTPLDLWVELETGGARRALRPFEQVVAQRPGDSKFRVTVNGVYLGSLAVDSRSAELKIKPESFSALERPKPAPDAPPAAQGTAILENRANVEVEVFRLDAQGKWVSLFNMEHNPRAYCGLTGSAGDIHVVRDRFQGGVLAMFVLGTQEPQLDLTITDEFRQRAASAAPTVTLAPSAGEVEVTNLTPLELQLDSVDQTTLQLQPLQKVKVNRPPFSKFTVTISGRRMAVLNVGPTTDELKIEPGRFSSLGPPKSVYWPMTRSSSTANTAPASAVFGNSTKFDVDIFWLDEAGQAIKKVTLHGGDSSDKLSSRPGYVYVARSTDTGEDMAMFLLQVGPQNLIITDEYRAKRAALTSATQPTEPVDLYNLTPLDLTIADSLGAEYQLPSLGTVRVQRQPLSRCAMKYRGIGVGTLALVPGTKKLTIDPGLVRTEEPNTTLGTGGFSFSNRPSASVVVNDQSKLITAIYRIEPSGQEVVVQGVFSSSVESGTVCNIAGASGDVHVVRDFATREVLDMFVLGAEPGQAVTITGDFGAKVAGEVEVVNLTPLDLDLEAGTGQPVHLKPFDRTRLARPRGRTFGVKHRGIHLRDLRVDSGIATLRIVPGMFSSLDPNKPATDTTTLRSVLPSSVRLENQTRMYADVFGLDHSGYANQEAHTRVRCQRGRGGSPRAHLSRSPHLYGRPPCHVRARGAARQNDAPGHR